MKKLRGVYKQTFFTSRTILVNSLPGLFEYHNFFLTWNILIHSRFHPCSCRLWFIPTLTLHGVSYDTKQLMAYLVCFLRRLVYICSDVIEELAEPFTVGWLKWVKVDAEVTAKSTYVLHSVRTHKTTSSSKSQTMQKWEGGERHLISKIWGCLSFVHGIWALYMRWETCNLVNCPMKRVCKPTCCSR